MEWLKMSKMGLAGWVLAAGIIGLGAYEGAAQEPAGPVAFAAEAAAAFRDTQGHWGEAAIRKAVGSGYVDGYENGTFRPDREVTRAEFLKLVLTATKVPVTGTGNGGGDWYVPFVNAAVANGLHQWSDFTNGDWNTPMTREEMARVAVRAVGEKNEDAKKWMYLATKAGLIQGTDDTGTLAVEGKTTRAQSVTIIERILDVKAGKTLPADKHAVSRAEVLWHKTNIFTVMPQYFGNVHPGGMWNPDDLFIESGDGLYRAELDELLAIDLEDENDPYLSEIQPVEELKWYNYVSSKNSPSLTMGIPAYVLIHKGPVVFNHDSNIYGERGGVALNILGAENDDWGSLEKGTLNGLTKVFRTKAGDLPMSIFPKKMKTDGDIMLDLYTPNMPGYKEYRKRILWSVTPEWIGQ